MSDALWFNYDVDEVLETMRLHYLWAAGLSTCFAEALRDHIVKCPARGSEPDNPEEMFANAKKWAEAIENVTDALLVGSDPPTGYREVVDQYRLLVDRLRNQRYFDPDDWDGPGLPAPDGLRCLPDAGEPLNYVCEWLFLNLFERAIPACEEGAYRLLELSMLAIEAVPAEPTLDFLRRVSRCYVSGFEPECVILCRSVLDSAFREVFDDDFCRSVLDARGEDEYSLCSRIRAAHKSMRISDAVQDAAFRVKYKGNEAVHHNPDANVDVESTIADTLQVLRAIA